MMKNSEFVRGYCGVRVSETRRVVVVVVVVAVAVAVRGGRNREGVGESEYWKFEMLSLF